MLVFKDNYAQFPEHMKETISKYVEHGVPVGGFLEAVITDNLRDAVFKADSSNLPLLRDYLLFFRWETPPQCHGSVENYKNWIASHARGETDERLKEVAAVQMFNDITTAG